MTLLEAIEQRRSIRRYLPQPLSLEEVHALQQQIAECNREGNLHIQLVLNEKRGFSGIMAYGSFRGVENYLVMAGQKADDLDYRVGYYGQKIVLLAQQLNLGTCWAGLSYRKIKNTFMLSEDEKVACMIALGHPNESGRVHKSKTVTDVSNADEHTPEWFHRGVQAALKAPTAVNQQKFSFRYLPPAGTEKAKVKADKGSSLIGYTLMDLGIAKLHFEIGAGTDHFDWAD